MWVHSRTAGLQSSGIVPPFASTPCGHLFRHGDTPAPAMLDALLDALVGDSNDLDDPAKSSGKVKKYGSVRDIKG